LLLQIDLFDVLLVGDVGGDLDANGASVDPADGPFVQVIPVAGQGVLELPVEQFAGQVFAFQQGRITVQPFVGRSAGGGDLGRVVADRIEAENALEGAIGKEDFAGLHIGDMDGRVETVDDGNETFVGALEFNAHPLRLGDVVHRGHPANLLAIGTDQWRKVEADVEAFAVLAHDAHLEAAGRGFAGQGSIDIVRELVEFLVRPVGVGRLDPDQFAFLEAGHPAEGGVDEGDAAFEVDGAQAGDQRLRHGLAKSVGRAQFFFGIGAVLGMAAQLDQGDGGDQGQDDDQRCRDERQPGAADAVGDDVEVEAIVGQVDADLAGDLAVGRLDRGVAEDLAIFGIDEGQAVARGERRRQGGAEQRFQRFEGDEGTDVGAAALDRVNDVVGRALRGIAIIRRNHRAAHAQGVLQGGQPHRQVVRRRRQRSIRWAPPIRPCRRYRPRRWPGFQAYRWRNGRP